MKAPQTKKSITTGRLGDPDTYVFQADVDFSSAYKRSNTMSSNSTTILLQKKFLLQKQERAEICRESLLRFLLKNRSGPR
jgi:hypothetical protein